MSTHFRYFKSSPEIIRLAVMMYVRFPLSLRNVEDLLHERGIDVCHETVRYWRNRFGPILASEIKKRCIRHRQFPNWRWHLDEVFVKVGGERRYLWRAVDHEGVVLDAVVTRKRDRKAAFNLLRRLMKKYGRSAQIVTDQLTSYKSALRQLGLAHIQPAGRWESNRAESSHLVFQRTERGLNKFRSDKSLQKFTAIHDQLFNHFNGAFYIKLAPYQAPSL